MTILELFDGALADRRDALAYGDVSFSRLHAGARRVATKLRDLGLRRGDRISLYTENRIGFVYAYLASLRLGTIAVPTNVLYRASDLGHVLHDSEAKAVIVSPQTTEFVAALAGGYPTIDVAEVERWAGDESIPQFAADYHLQAEDVALIVYTSGTTGRSKGAMLTYGNLAMIAIQVATTWRWQTSDTLVIALPLFHIHGLCAGLGASLAVGGRIVVHERCATRRRRCSSGSRRCTCACSNTPRRGRSPNFGSTSAARPPCRPSSMLSSKSALGSRSWNATERPSSASRSPTATPGRASRDPSGTRLPGCPLTSLGPAGASR